MPSSKPFYVTDTHAFVWYLAEDERLGSSAKAVFEQADRGVAVIIIPAVALAEALYLTDKGKVKTRAKEMLGLVENALN